MTSKLLIRFIFLCWSTNLVIGHWSQGNNLQNERNQKPTPTTESVSNNPASCPKDSAMISPCTCSLNKTSRNGKPELSCINFVNGSNAIPLNQVFRKLSDHLDSNGESKRYERLLLVNSQMSNINGSLFHDLQFNYLSIYETNLTMVNSDSFTNMADTLTYLLMKSNRLKTIFSALKQLKNLETLVLNLGDKSFQTIDSKSLVDMPQLKKVTLNGIMNSINSDAFVNLPSLTFLKITNQLESIQNGAFNFTQNNSTNTTDLTIDLSNNKLNENSFEVGFLQLKPEITVKLDLTYNSLSFLPEEVFRPFFEINSDNRLLMKNNKFKCGNCVSYWLIKNITDIQDRLEVNCYQNNQITIWDYDWRTIPYQRCTTNDDCNSLCIGNGYNRSECSSRLLRLNRVCECYDCDFVLCAKYCTKFNLKFMGCSCFALPNIVGTKNYGSNADGNQLLTNECYDNKFFCQCSK
ncbi:hypothetical protein RDWZM_008485 [Blomia tropicalis]|uniref:Uncharacterized protein n=1 Tax=Blomia tropicalis TaxID=40697 RepID=A0A9Q0RIW5_BLOTA|nr:hypothetical protein RDWZM_008485 [Blomia tropicalis]